MPEIKIHMFHTGKVCVAPELPFSGERCSTLKASGVFAKNRRGCGCPCRRKGRGH